MSFSDNVQRIKRILREEEGPFFKDEDVQFYLVENNGNVNATIYQMLLITNQKF